MGDKANPDSRFEDAHGLAIQLAPLSEHDVSRIGGPVVAGMECRASVAAPILNAEADRWHADDVHAHYRDRLKPREAYSRLPSAAVAAAVLADRRAGVL
ncbi:hypothetical protein [Xanthomonas campestris]|uniref:hypothetical protein n=1 Tax=Xanthomonas campestris TaxID=339 RepID=UPI001EDEDB50|nr:hypothetical protein [Xanthomonas campestris]